MEETFSYADLFLGSGFTLSFRDILGRRKISVYRNVVEEKETAYVSSEVIYDFRRHFKGKKYIQEKSHLQKSLFTDKHSRFFGPCAYQDI